ncbi:phosphoenolpyruvate--protein phosphotransferase [Dictyobacter arantiisoli]|uniref:Phosphoenolpyruvate-protein phosphotransferase n=1 Tax=Dictyobacter arantiisoli TaxID=2014874 RepID=A0A5A5TBM4_9CHLR|nr:phosphoenolpyruvate--protein phosphotransferase [Dictyobacter arantiisoli]GCF08890.1 phosphoenolpyruvate-protein phosphotransferase [Dictyobacter arantiisoli]
MSSTLQTLHGIPVTGGVAIGSWIVYDPFPPAIPHTTIDADALASEKERLQQAIQASIAEVTALRDHVLAKVGPEEAEIFDAHLLMFEDDSLLESTHQRIEQEHQNAVWAVWDAADEIAQMFAGMENEYFRARAADVYDIRARIVNHLLGRPTAQLRSLKEPVIVVARDLLPSDTAGLDPALVLGLVTEQGGATSHTAILARQMGIPAVVGVNGLFEQIAAATAEHAASSQLLLDGSSGEIVLHPDIETVARYQQTLERYRQQQQQLQSLRTLSATTLDGKTIEVAANIGRPRDAQPALEAGAGGVGLFRTEFLFLDRATPPSEEEQVEAYTTVLNTFAAKTVIVRTLDIGGDKSVPYLDLPHEDNPFLGVRGIRLCLEPEHQHLFRTQIRALLLAAQTQVTSLWIMFPMICDLRELRQARAFVAETEAQLLQEGKLAAPVLSLLRLGIMIETPASVWVLDQLAQEADFFSIGTNDLAQYTLASDRMNACLNELQRPFHPAVMRTIAHIVRIAHQYQRWVGMCGEMAGNPRASAFLLGLGIDELSMEAGSLNAVKQAIRGTTIPQALEIVERVLAADSSAAIEDILS